MCEFALGGPAREPPNGHHHDCGALRATCIILDSSHKTYDGITARYDSEHRHPMIVKKYEQGRIRSISGILGSCPSRGAMSMPDGVPAAGVDEGPIGAPRRSPKGVACQG